jgi:tyrosine-specific transport protein
MLHTVLGKNMGSQSSKIVGGVLLVAGTQIGAGMLALPLTTGIAGFGYAALTFVLCFLYMLITLFLLLETNYYSKAQSANIISMAQQHLGKGAELVAWTCFVLLMYSALAAYISGAGDIVKNILHTVVPDWHTPEIGRAILIAIVFGIIVFYGARCIDSINRVLMLGLGFSYVTMVVTLLQSHAEYLPAAIPVVILSFTSHIILPSLRDYLENDIIALKKVLIIGSCIPMVIYLLWVMIIVGIIPFDGKLGMFAVAKSNHPVAMMSNAIAHFAGSNIIGQNNNLFSFCALTTSLLGVLLSLQDFLADGLKIQHRTTQIRIALILACTIPPLILIILSPGLFVDALSYGGVFIAILYGVLPPIMAWKARYRESLSSAYQLPGGKPALVVIMSLALTIIVIQIALTQGYLPTA